MINKLLTNHPDRHDPSNYVIRWDQFEFIPEALEGLKLLADTDYKILVVSNQSGIGRGYVEYDEVMMIFERMCGNVAVQPGDEYENVRDYGGRIDHYIFCSHKPDANCCCRKPNPGMLYDMAIHWEIDLSQSWMIGDSQSDIEAGVAAGIKNLIYINSNVPQSEQPIQFSDNPRLSLVSHAPNLLVATEMILQCSS